MNDTGSLQACNTGRREYNTITQSAIESISLVTNSSLNILNSHYTGTESHNFIKSVPDLTDVAFALGSAYKNTIDSISHFFSLSKKETSERNNSLFFETIKWDNYKIQLKQPVALDIDFSDDFWEGSNEDLGIYLATSDLDQLKKDFNEEFFVMWDVYSKKPDIRLTEKAKEIKYKILDLVMGVSVEY